MSPVNHDRPPLSGLDYALRHACTLLRSRYCFGWALAVLPVVAVEVQPALAGRYVLNQNPAAIERTFGRYWTKLTQTHANGQKTVTYTYSPAPLRRFFRDRPFADLSMVYVNDRVQSVTMRPYKTAQEKRDYSIKLDSNTVTERAMEARLFESIFGYRPSIYKPLSLITGTTYYYTTCLGDGVASSYSIGHSESLMDGITLAYNPTCEPPYDRIKFTEGRGPSGG